MGPERLRDALPYDDDEASEYARSLAKGLPDTKVGT